MLENNQKIEADETKTEVSTQAGKHYDECKSGKISQEVAFS
jgi:hypothetical protein